MKELVNQTAAAQGGPERIVQAPPRREGEQRRFPAPVETSNPPALAAGPQARDREEVERIRAELVNSIPLGWRGSRPAYLEAILTEKKPTLKEACVRALTAFLLFLADCLEPPRPGAGANRSFSEGPRPQTTDNAYRPETKRGSAAGEPPEELTLGEALGEALGEITVALCRLAARGLLFLARKLREIGEPRPVYCTSSPARAKTA